MSGEICTDNRFEVISAYKRALVESTNIETSPDEMAVIDNVLFRFWQMGWLNPHMTNADRIRAMTDEELADFHGEYTCPPNYNWSGGCERGRDEYCEKCWLDWLKQEAEDADVKPVVRGEWKPSAMIMSGTGSVWRTHGVACSVCNSFYLEETNYCPNCGADMRGDNI